MSSYTTTYISPAPGGSGEWQCGETSSDEATFYPNPDCIIAAYRHRASIFGAEIVVLGIDHLPEGVQDIRGHIHNEPARVVAIILRNVRFVEYFGIVRI